MSACSEHPETLEIDGLVFRRDRRSGYYALITAIRLHRYVYITRKGPIPKGHHVHHIDGDRGNNDPENLELLPPGVHASRHGNALKASVAGAEALRKRMDYARLYASEWHRSPAGKEWHSLQGKRNGEVVKPQQYSCAECGTAFWTKPYGRVKFCSLACGQRYRIKSGSLDEARSCEACGGSYRIFRYAKNRTCSRSCGATLRHRKKRHANRPC